MMLRRELHLPNFHIDTNLINGRQKLEEVNQLEEWAIEDLILINMSKTAFIEALRGDNPERTRKAYKQIFTCTDPASEHSAEFIKVGKILFPEGISDENQKNDVRIVCEAAKYAAILVTNDGASRSQPGGILGNRKKLNDFVEILNPQEAVEMVKVKLLERDAFNKQCHELTNEELPTWMRGT